MLPNGLPEAPIARPASVSGPRRHPCPIHRSCFWRDVSRHRHVILLPRNSGGFANFDLVAEFFDATRETLRGPFLIHAGEVERPEITIRHLIPQQIISRGQDRSGHRDNSLLWPAPCA